VSLTNMLWLLEFLPESFSVAQKTALFTHEDCLKHLTPVWHNERPERLSAIIDVVKLIQVCPIPLILVVLLTQ